LERYVLQITFLGTSSGVPTRSRNVSSVAVRLPQRAEFWLFDCGEGTQHQLLRSEIKSSQLTRIFVTHMHGDHIYGLMGLLASCGLAGNVSASIFMVRLTWMSISKPVGGIRKRISLSGEGTYGTSRYCV
jgi:ribonuclease BN (tRNA processing enzyme)